MDLPLQLVSGTPWPRLRSSRDRYRLLAESILSMMVRLHEDSLKNESVHTEDSLSSGVLGDAMVPVATTFSDSLDDQLLKGVLDSDLDSTGKALAKGANIHVRSQINYTPIMHAVEMGNWEMLKLLLEYGADVCDDFGAYNVLMVLCDSTCTDDMSLLKCLNLLLEHGADPTVSDWMGATPLLHAVRQNRQQLALRLIDTGCSINTPDSEGWTPLFHAVQNNDLSTVQLLIDCGAKINLVDRSGRTLRDVATATNNKDIIKMVTTDQRLELAIPKSSENLSRSSCSPYKSLLAEAPNLHDRLFGFHHDAIQFLRGTGLTYVASVMSTKNLQFAALLTWRKSDWTSAGIHLTYPLLKIRTCVRQFHEKEWSRNAIPDLSHVYEDGQVDLFRVVLALASFLRMTHISSASTLYLLNHFAEDTQNPTLPEDVLEQINAIFINLAVIKKQIPDLIKICQEIERSDKFEYPDFIGKPSTTEKPSKFRLPFIFGCLVCGRAAVYFLRKYVQVNLGRQFLKFQS
ncbi:hypothetical protein GE061_007872 [Apolygus lucorum]|uniref:Uncharacterized protein n=1 Tax=Apolygus lucorum TaxID=248454 RepID=A0A8S9WRU2_APOLU|nr:hypothetical protein GE061_007872 [Apolygus lucorum]